MRRTLPILASAIASAVLAAPAAAQTPAACPATFAVLHDDRVGALQLPAGDYALTVVGVTCADAADRFRQFLQDVDGRLPAPWRVDAATATFTGAAGQSFSVARAAQPSGGGGGMHPATGAPCAAPFSVLHDDRIGALRLPAGQYAITLLSVGPMTCAQAAARFAAFLQDWNGRLPRGWLLDPETGTFLRGLHVGFRVKPTGAPPTDSAVGTRCGGDAFSIEFPHRFPGLRIRAGAYRVWALAASCNRAAQQLGRLLDLRQGRLPRGWSVDPATATFSRRGTAQFRIKRER